MVFLIIYFGHFSLGVTFFSLIVDMFLLSDYKSFFNYTGYFCQSLTFNFLIFFVIQKLLILTHSDFSHHSLWSAVLGSALRSLFLPHHRKKSILNYLLKLLAFYN